MEVEKEISCVILVKSFSFCLFFCACEKKCCCISLYLWDSSCFVSKFLLQGIIYLLVSYKSVVYRIFVNSLKSCTQLFTTFNELEGHIASGHSDAKLWQWLCSQGKEVMFMLLFSLKCLHFSWIFFWFIPSNAISFPFLPSLSFCLPFSYIQIHSEHRHRK